MKNIVLIDLSTYQVTLHKNYKKLLAERLKIESSIIYNTFGFKPKRGSYSYSRGLLQIGASLIDNGFNVIYIIYSDLSDRDRLLRAASSADVAGFTSVTPTILLAAKIATILKKANPNIKTVVGGPHATALPKKTLEEFEAFDYAVCGPGEETLLELILNIGKNASVDNVAFRDNKGRVLCKTKTKKIKPNKYAPAYKLLHRPINEYAHNVRTQEGCLYNCKFCAESSRLNSRQRQEYIDGVVYELRYLHEFCDEKTLVHFSDPIFNINEKHTSSLCEKISEFSDKFIYSIDTRVELITTDFAKTARSSGIKYFRIGATYLQESLLRGERCKSLLDSIVDASERIKSSPGDSIIHLYWMTGLPGTNLENLKQSSLIIEDLIIKGHVHIIGNRIFVPYPGTYLFANPKKYGIRMLNKSWAFYDRLSAPVYRLNTLSENEIYDQFIRTECLQVEAYKQRNGCCYDSFTGPMDYVYSNYIEK